MPANAKSAPTDRFSALYDKMYQADRTPERRLRIGSVSPDLHPHVVASFLEPILSAHAHEHFGITCYANVAAGTVGAILSWKWVDISLKWLDVSLKWLDVSLTIA